MTLGDGDPALRRFERDAILACLATAVVAALAAAATAGVEAAVRMALGVAGGGLLTAFSYRAIKGAVDVVLRTAEAVRRPEIPGSGATVQGSTQGRDGAAHDHRSEQGRDVAAHDHRSEQGRDGAALDHRSPLPRQAFLAVKFFTRYALLAVAAYVMLTCLRLHPVGVLAGATSPFIAALVQVGRLSGARASRPRR